jgi:hypothetical protein
MEPNTPGPFLTCAELRMAIKNQAAGSLVELKKQRQPHNLFSPAH